MFCITYFAGLVCFGICKRCTIVTVFAALLLPSLLQSCFRFCYISQFRLQRITLRSVYILISLVTAHLQIFRNLPVRDTGFLQMKKLLDLTHVNDCSCHIPLPFLISAKLGDLTRWWPTMLRKNRAPAAISSGFCSFYLSFYR